MRRTLYCAVVFYIVRMIKVGISERRLFKMRRSWSRLINSQFVMKALRVHSWISIRADAN